MKKELLRCRSTIRSIEESMYVLLLTSREERYEKGNACVISSRAFFSYIEKKGRYRKAREITTGC